MTVRAMRLRAVTPADAALHLEALEAEYSERKRPQPRPPTPVNAIRKYNGKEFSGRMQRP